MCSGLCLCRRRSERKGRSVSVSQRLRPLEPSSGLSAAFHTLFKAFQGFPRETSQSAEMCIFHNYDQLSGHFNCKTTQRQAGLSACLSHHSLDRLAFDSAIAQTSAGAKLVGRCAEHTCCQNYLRCDKVNYAAVGALSRLSDVPGVCTGAAVPGLQECHSADSAPRKITSLS